MLEAVMGFLLIWSYEGLGSRASIVASIKIRRCQGSWRIKSVLFGLFPCRSFPHI